MGRTSPSWRIGGKAAQTFYYAEQQARRIGLPLTHSVTINFASTRIDPREAVHQFSKLRRNRFNKWATRPVKYAGPAFAPTYAHAFENARDGVPFLTIGPGEPHNVHVHWAIHLPATRVHDFQNQIWQWVDEMTGGVSGGAETILIKPYTEQYSLGYLLKGSTPSVASRYARGRQAEDQGIIIGRRADTSRNLGPTARRACDRELGIRRKVPSRRSGEASPPP